MEPQPSPSPRNKSVEIATNYINQQNLLCLGPNNDFSYHFRNFHPFSFSQREFSFSSPLFFYLHFYFQSQTSPTERFEALRYDSGLDSASIVPYQRTSTGVSTFGVIFHSFFSTTISRRKFSVRFSFERLTPTQSSLASDVLLSPTERAETTGFIDAAIEYNQTRCFEGRLQHSALELL